MNTTSNLNIILRSKSAVVDTMLVSAILNNDVPSVDDVVDATARIEQEGAKVDSKTKNVLLLLASCWSDLLMRKALELQLAQVKRDEGDTDKDYATKQAKALKRLFSAYATVAPLLPDFAAFGSAGNADQRYKLAVKVAQHYSSDDWKALHNDVSAYRAASVNSEGDDNADK